MKPVTQYEELIRAIEKADDFLATKSGIAPEFEATGDPEKPFRTEYAHESITESKSRYKHTNIDN